MSTNLVGSSSTSACRSGSRRSTPFLISRIGGLGSSSSSSNSSRGSSSLSSKGYVPRSYRRPRNPAVPNYNSRVAVNRFKSTIGN
mmetsp:Transcript_35003/g.39803  ORF Transcript_35003/g.39803 Transcript_35003/m.39803 type:complete len:85 (+) Transcript_35003:343-597(+)